MLEATFGGAPGNGYEAEIKRAVERVVIDELSQLAAGASMPQVRAIATMQLEIRRDQIRLAMENGGQANLAHFRLLARDIQRQLDQPSAPYTSPNTVSAPPGAPIGEPAMEWIRKLVPPVYCTSDWRR